MPSDATTWIQQIRTSLNGRIYNSSMRKVVIVGPPPVQVLDVTGPLEVFSSAGGYDVILGNPGQERVLRTNRNFALTDALPIHEITGAIDTLVIAGGPGAETGTYDRRLCRG